MLLHQPVSEFEEHHFPYELAFNRRSIDIPRNAVVIRRYESAVIRVQVFGFGIVDDQACDVLTHRSEARAVPVDEPNFTVREKYVFYPKIPMTQNDRRRFIF